MATTDRKLYLGPRLRVLRRDLGINQTRMADELGISPSYLNHLERNQRPLTAQMLVRLANTYDVDMRDFVAGGGGTSSDDLAEALRDPLVQDIGVPRHEQLEVAENYPAIAEAITRYQRALSDLRRTPDLADQIRRGERPAAPLEWLGDHFTARRNHFPELDAAAEVIGAELDEDPLSRAIELRDMLAKRCRIEVRIVPGAVLTGALRHHDFHRRRLMVSERLSPSSRAFAFAYQVSLTLLIEPIEAQIGRAEPPNAETRTLLKIALANYAAAALLMPYVRFQAAAEETRHDLQLLSCLFGVSPEQAAHRLTTLDRAGARGIPFFLMRVDRARNVSKRLPGADGGAIARLGERCPRWNLAGQPEWPGEIVEMPDGSRYLTYVQVLPSLLPERRRGPSTLVLGCEAKHASRVGFADGLDVSRAVTIGPGCRLCERIACPDRAMPPTARTLEVSSFRRMAGPYAFRPV